jgi:tRNA(fMet)-specific endonuclease VapC
MILLDSDHVSVVLESRHSLRPRLLARLDQVFDDVALPVVTAEEQLRGWLAQINRQRDIRRQIVPYSRLVDLLKFMEGWTILTWNDETASWFEQLRAARVRIGTQDLKIASIALANNGLLLSANLRDFEKVPGLNVEDWLR